MAKINLLPHRQERRKERREAFYFTCIVVAAVAAFLVFVWNSRLSSQIEEQHAKNTYIEAEVKKMDDDIKVISDLQKRKDELLSRMSVIQDLQGRRPVIVRIFDELVRVIPDGVYLVSLDRAGDVFHIAGVAQNNNQISNLMRNIQASPWFKDPELSKVAAEMPNASAGTGGAKPNEPVATNNDFSMTFKLQLPDMTGHGGPATGKAGAK